MAEILYLMPGGAMDAAEVSRREVLANSFLTMPDRYHVSVRSVGYGADSIECFIDGDFSVTGLLQYALSHKGGYDALIIGCTDDPGLFSLREVLTVPVVGPMESSVAIASLLGHSFGVIATEQSAVPESHTLLRKYGVDSRCVSIRCLNQSAAALRHYIGDALEHTLLQRLNEVAQDGADCAVLGCMSMAFGPLDEKVAKNSPIPIINPAKASIKTAETLLELGLRHSDASYPKPNMIPILEILN